MIQVLFLPSEGTEQMIPASSENVAAIRRESVSSRLSQGAHGCWTDLSVLLCAAILLAACVGGNSFVPQTRTGKNVRLAALIGIWYWTTTTWAAETKQILATFSSGTIEPGFPLLGFWLTFMPQLMSSVLCIMGLCWRFGSSVTT